MAREGVRLPPHPYVPGRTSRPPEDLFDDLKAPVRPGMESGRLAQTGLWRFGWRCFNAGYFWEAHELFEPIWLSLPPNSAERALVQAVIQLANAALKLRMGRPRAVDRLCDRVEQHLAMASRAGTAVMGVELDTLRRSVENLRSGKEPETVAI